MPIAASEDRRGAIICKIFLSDNSGGAKGSGTLMHAIETLLHSVRAAPERHRLASLAAMRYPQPAMARRGQPPGWHGEGGER
jgi:hypothetical protein